jgi:hypothetical protein
MPKRDGTGPVGVGVMTGRGLGPCAGANPPNYRPRFGAGCGAGFGWRLSFPCRLGGFKSDFAGDSVSPKTRKELLNDQKDFLKDRLEAIEKQLEEL